MSLQLENWRDYLTHPESYRLVDEVADFHSGVSIHTRFHFGEGLPFLEESKSRAVPPALLLEAIFQAAALLALGSVGLKANAAIISLMTINNARFKAPVSSKEPIDIHARILNQQGGTYRFEGRIDLSDQNAVFNQFVATYLAKENPTA